MAGIGGIAGILCIAGIAGMGPHGWVCLRLAAGRLGDGRDERHHS